jgi:hypothetical protein
MKFVLVNGRRPRPRHDDQIRIIAQRKDHDPDLAVFVFDEVACFAGFSASLALFTGRNERRHAHPTS